MVHAVETVHDNGNLVVVQLYSVPSPVHGTCIIPVFITFRESDGKPHVSGEPPDELPLDVMDLFEIQA